MIEGRRRAAPGGPPCAFAIRLLDWFDAHARDLPWRRARTPYSVLVSELMLQQTTVRAAVPFYERFLARFPGWAALASAPLDDVLAAWAGLGYYRRARSLHAIAQAVVARGDFPADAAEARALPGIGPYTAGAVLSLAMGQPLPAVDGNVARVLARHAGEPLNVSRERDRRRLEALALGLQAADRPGDFNEALMELGATICTPRSPACLLCPVADDCRARVEGRVGELPPRAPRAPPREVRAAAAVIVERGRVLLARRGDGERVMPGLWELPGGWSEREAGSFLESDVLPALGGGRVLERLGSVRHVVTTRRITVELLRCELSRRAPRRDDLAWRTSTETDLALTGATRRALPLVAAAIREEPR